MIAKRPTVSGSEPNFSSVYREVSQKPWRSAFPLIFELLEPAFYIFRGCPHIFCQAWHSLARFFGNQLIESHYSLSYSATDGLRGDWMCLGQLGQRTKQPKQGLQSPDPYVHLGQLMSGDNALDIDHHCVFRKQIPPLLRSPGPEGTMSHRQMDCFVGLRPPRNDEGKAQ